MNHNDVDNFGKFIVNGMMLALLWAIIALPISTFSLIRLEPSEDNDVLSAQDQRMIENIQEDYKEDENKSFRPSPVRDETYFETYIFDY